MKFESMKNPELHGWCKSSGAQSLNGRKKFIAALPEVFRRRMYKEYGFGSIYEYAAKLCGVSRAMVDEVIRIDEKLKEMPELRSKIAEVGLSKVKVVASVATKETDHEWAAKITKMTRSAAETHVRDIKKKIPGDRNLIKPKNLTYSKELQDCTFKLDPEVMLKLRIIKNKMRKGTTWNEVFERLVEGAIPESKPQKNPRPSNSKSRHLTAQKRRELEGKCSTNGCNKPATEIHHKKPWSIHKSHDELEPFCKDHHELAHQSDSTIDVKFRQYKMQVAMF